MRTFDFCEDAFRRTFDFDIHWSLRRRSSGYTEAFATGEIHQTIGAPHSRERVIKTTPTKTISILVSRGQEDVGDGTVFGLNNFYCQSRQGMILFVSAGYSIRNVSNRPTFHKHGIAIANTNSLVADRGSLSTELVFRTTGRQPFHPFRYHPNSSCIDWLVAVPRLIVIAIRKDAVEVHLVS